MRLRQFISLQESRTAGDQILVIFPDGTGPALLSSMVAGIPFRDVHALEFEPGEIRLDITPESVMALFEQRKNDPVYLKTLEDGKEKLTFLRTQNNLVTGLKEQKAEQERLALEQEFQTKQKLAQEKEQQRLGEIAKQKEAQLQAQQKALEDRRERERQRQQEAAAVARSSVSVAPSSSSFGDNGMVGATGALGVLGVGLAAMAANTFNDKDQPKDAVIVAESPNTTLAQESESAKAEEPNTIRVELPPSLSDTRSNTTAIAAKPSTSNIPSLSEEKYRTKDGKPTISANQDSTLEAPTGNQEEEKPPLMETMGIETANRQPPAIESDGDNNMKDDNNATDDDFLEQMAVQSVQTDSDKKIKGDETTIKEQLDKLNAGQQVMDDWMVDNGANDWLKAMAEIRDEEDNDKEENYVYANGDSNSRWRLADEDK